MWFLISAVICLYLILKIVMYRITICAILMFYLESGIEPPEKGELQEYRLKVVKSYLGIKED